MEEIKRSIKEFNLFKIDTLDNIPVIQVGLQSFKVNVDMYDEEDLKYALHPNMSNNSIAKQLSGILSISPDTISEIKDTIDFNEDRYGFTMVLEQKLRRGRLHHTYIQGYTSTITDEISNLNFIINSFTEHITHVNGIGCEECIACINSNSVLFNYTKNKDLKTILPTDRVSRIHTGGVTPNDLDVLEYKEFKSDEMVITRRQNSSPINYFRQVSLAYDELQKEVENIWENDWVPVTDYHGILPDNVKAEFTIKDLLDIDSEFNVDDINITNHTNKSKDESSEEYNWIRSIEPYTASLSVVNMLSGILAENLVSKADIKFNTMNTVIGLDISNIVPINSLVDIDKTKQIISNYIKKILVPYITENNVYPIGIDTNLNLTGISTISIDYDMTAIYDFKIPTYADSLYNPSITDKVSLEKLDNDLKTILSKERISFYDY